MNIELVRQLKEAGFPHEWTILWDEKENWPSLSELIKACGKHFEALYLRQDNTWTVASIEMMMGGYKTPEIAVAKLWLALNKKSNG